MKKVVSLTLAAAMTLTCASVLLTTGCADDKDLEHTIVFYSSQGDALSKITKNAIDSFEEKYPGWKVEHQTLGGYDNVKEKVMSDLQGEQQPDLAYCYADHVAQYLESEQVIDINKYIYSTETVTGKDGVEYTVGYSANELEDFVSTYYEEGRAKNFSGYDKYGFESDSMLTLPFLRSTEVMYYNKTALENLGWDVATTWTELWEQCEQLKGIDALKKATPLGYDSEANWFITMCQQKGWGYTSATGNNYLFNQNNDALRGWLEELHTYHNLGYFTTQTEYGGYTSALFTKGLEEGGLLYCIGSSGGASNQDPKGAFVADVAPIPGTGTDSSVISQGPSLCMFKAGSGVANADEKANMTFLFIKELLDVNFQADISSESGYNPVRSSVWEDDQYMQFLESGTIKAKAVLASNELTENTFTSPAFVGSSVARTQVGNVLYYVMRGEKTVNQALSDAYKNCGGK